MVGIGYMLAEHIRFDGEIGRKCAPNRSTVLLEEFRRSVVKLKSYIVANSDISAEDIAKSLAEQSQSEAELCHGEAMQFFEDTIADLTVDNLRMHVDQIIARPGDPEEGDCL